MRVDVYSRHDAYVGTIGARQLLSFIWTDCLNGEDTVDITTTYPLKEGYRLVWQDLNGEPHEHVCQDPKGASAAGLPIYSDTALNSICELFGDYIEDKRPYGYSFQRALEVCLEPTRWEVGTVDQPGTVSGGLTFYHTDCRSALNSILECGGELQTSITVGADGVTHRRVSILKHRGEANGHRRFSYGKDINSITRTEHWGAITACYGYGKGVETDSGGYGRKLTFGEINNGKDYVEDAEALKLYGRPDGKGGIKHVFGKYENPSCEDAHQLKDETQDYLDQHKTPGVTYEADVVDLVAMGRPWEGVGVGDDTQMVDSSFEPTLRCQGRVTKLVSDLLAKTQSVTLGNVTESIADILQQQQQQISNLQNQSGSWDAVAGTTPAFLQQLIDSLNEQFNMNGMSYMHVSYQNGFIFSSVPLDEDGRPTATGGTAMQLCSLGFRIAAGTKADGSYDWRTFGTGNGFVADWITTGTLMANLIKAGRMVVGDPNDPVFMVDFDSKDVVISATASVGNSSAGDIVVSADVQYGLSDSANTQPTSWTTTALWQNGKHMWTRVKMTLADGSIQYTAPRRISNDKGIGAAEVIEQYYLSTSNTTQTGGTWSNTQPTWVKGHYYWTRSRITWSDGSVTYTTPVLASALTSGNQSTDDLDTKLDKEEVFNRLTDNGAVQGLYMKDGKLYLNGEYIQTGTIKVEKNGQTVFSADIDTGDVTISALANLAGSQAGSVVVSADVQYGLSDSSTVQPTTWSTTALWAQGKHLWTRVKMELADGTIEYTTPRRIANESGIGAAEVIEQYYLSTSSTTQTGGYWSNTQPVWVSGRYYWTRSRIKWSNGTYTYTDPVLARGLTSGNQSTDNLDNSLTQREVFNRLTNNGQTQGVYLSNSKLYINASYIATGTISDATGKNYWNLSSGYLRTTSGYIGGLTIENSYVGNSVFRLTNSGIHFYYSNYELGKIGTNSYTGDSSKRGLVFDLENEGSYMTWAVAKSASASTYTMKLSYINQAFGGFSTDTIALGCDLDGRNYTAHNFYIDPDSGGASGGVTNTLSGMLPTSINSDGTVAHWTTNVRLQFKRGLLVGMYS